MSYYQTGDYYLAGDPGLLSSIGGFLKRGVQTGVGFITGGIGGAIRANFPQARPFASGRAPQLQLPHMFPGGAMIARGGRGVAASGPEAGTPPRGYHLNRSDYHLKDGTYVPKGTRYVRNRSRNFANGRALNRAISRTAGFNRLVKRSRKNLRALSKI